MKSVRIPVRIASRAPLWFAAGFCLTALGVAAQGPRSAEAKPAHSETKVTEALLALDGAWSGTLGFRDDQTDAWIKLGVDVDVAADREAGFVAVHTALDQGDNAERSSSVRLFDAIADVLVDVELGARDAPIALQRRTFVSQGIEGPGRWTLVLKRDGLEDGRPAAIRETLERDGDRYVERKEVRYDEGGAWTLRSELSLARTPAPTLAALAGTWVVDLRPTPDAPAYTQELVLALEKGGGSLTGSFYGSPLAEVRVNTAFGSPHVAFTTADGAGTYATVARLVGDELRGTTHSLGRDFLSVWTATRTSAPPSGSLPR